MSFEDWDMLQWSLGWTGVLDPSSPPRSWIARFEMTWERRGEGKTDQLLVVARELTRTKAMEVWSRP